MTAGGPGRSGAATAGSPGAPGAAPSGQTAEVRWFDTRKVTLSPADLAGLDARETARAAAFVFPADRHRYQAAHVLLRRVLAARLGTEPGQLTFGRQPCPACGGPSGRPVLVRAGADQPGLSFSLAHSGEAVAIAVTAGVPVGIDVERQPSGCVCSLASAMHAEDAARVQALPEPDRHLAVIRWWVRAEAVLKCAGTGIAHGMDAFPVLGAQDLTRWATAAGCSFAGLPAPEGYHAALALPGSLAPDGGGAP